MGYKIGVLTLHGMGAQKKGYSASWEENIRGKLSTEACEEVVFEEVYYQDIMQREQMNLWENRLDWETKSLCPLALVILLGVTVWVAAWVAALVTAVIRNWGVVDSLALALGLTALTIALAIATVFAVAKLQHRVWVHVRKFLLYAFSDPATYAYKYDEPGSIYQQVHKRVSARLKSLCEKLGRRRLRGGSGPLVGRSRTVEPHLGRRETIETKRGRHRRLSGRKRGV